MDGINIVVQEESRQNKRNCAFHVPLVVRDFGRTAMRKPPTSPRSIATENIKTMKMNFEQHHGRARVRSASAGRDKKSELHARYWAFLFGNLQRAVDEIYQTCESDESVSQCKEVMMVLDTYSRDFRNLIDWFKIKWDYEKTPPPQRPTSLAWEIRKSSPGKIQGLRTTEPSLVEAARRKIPFNDQTSVDSSKASSSVNSGDESSLTDVASERCQTPNTSDEKVVDEQPLEQIAEVPKEEAIEIPSQNVAPTSDEPVSTVEKKECEMVDEVCQTDREEDVDENGPKFRSVSLQTCPVLSGLNENEKPTKILKVDVKEESKPKPALTLKSPLVAPAKSPVKNNATASPLRPAWGAPPRPTFPKQNVVRAAYSTVSRQSLNAKPNPGNPAKQTGQQVMLGKLTRCRTVGEVRLGKFSESPLRGRKTLPSNQTASSGQRGTSQCPKPVSKTPILSQESKTRTNLSGSKIEDSVSFSNSSSSIHSSGSSCTVVTTAVRRSLPPRNVADEDGWVKVRSRSRFSPANKLESLDTSLSRSATNLKPRVTIARNTAKTRYHAPSSAKSLPSLAFTASNNNQKAQKPSKTSKPAPSKEPPKKVEPASNEVVKKPKSFQKYIDSCSVEDSPINQSKDESSDCGKIEDAKQPEKPETERDLNVEKDADGDKICSAESDGNDEDENKFDEEMKKNTETEERLQKEIKELESTEIDVETGDEETDGETTETTGTEDERESDRETITPTNSRKPSPKKQYHYETIMQGLSWADHMDTLNELEKLVVQNCSNEGMTPDEQLDTLERLEVFLARHPGRAMELHQKLSSPSRKRSIPETVKRFQARQAKALAKRESLQMEKAQKLRELLRKVNEVKAVKEKLIEDRRQRLEKKLERAAANRSQHLKEIMRKAHDEEEKLKEIAFINELEAQNKRHDFLALRQEQEDRLQEMLKKYDRGLSKFVYNIVIYDETWIYSYVKQKMRGTVLSDSPAGLAAYIIEKFSTWTNNSFKTLPDGGLTKKFTLDQLLDNVMLYWVTNSITTSQRLYSEAFTFKQLAYRMEDVAVTIPSACARFRNELQWQPEALIKLKYKDMVQLTDYEDGGHFAAFELPQVMAKDIISAIDKMERRKTTKK